MLLLEKRLTSHGYHCSIVLLHQRLKQVKKTPNNGKTLVTRIKLTGFWIFKIEFSSHNLCALGSVPLSPWNRGHDPFGLGLVTRQPQNSLNWVMTFCKVTLIILLRVLTTGAFSRRAVSWPPQRPIEPCFSGRSTPAQSYFWSPASLFTRASC